MPFPTLQRSAFALGFLTGARSFTPTAVLCWGSRLGWFGFRGTPFAVLDRPASLAVASLLAAGELVGDKLPNTPARTAALPLLGRIALGASAGAALGCAAGSGDQHEPVRLNRATLPEFAPVLLAGALGALAGTFATFHARRAFTKGIHVPDLPVALLEDALVLAGAIRVAAHPQLFEEPAHG